MKLEIVKEKPPTFISRECKPGHIYKSSNGSTYLCIRLTNGHAYRNEFISLTAASAWLPAGFEADAVFTYVGKLALTEE